MKHRSALTTFRARQARRTAERELAAQLAVFSSPRDLTDLAAILDRHPDSATTALRDAVEWTRAA